VDAVSVFLKTELWVCMAAMASYFRTSWLLVLWYSPSPFFSLTVPPRAGWDYLAVSRYLASCLLSSAA
jgi:hypothetical protein